ncbi:MAG: transporter substrate-binding domain-containing protein [Alphaproteobacteria bacterium]|nr:transporter substrate-binding domain-containing protein [Alphaproteobacteria bacterium]MBT5159273.1 transporter substrate-binding domain-containing protein [Alphaproteobacteria bacterium]MBT6386922.1 transporter substrate-binding domain-containing protein [Alphaproteobacteria bacterium]MBT7744793.1 transporter substrate-binding domain-containing protein [Alphaproteobacteria bacterium]
MSAEVEVMEASARAILLAVEGVHDGVAERSAGLEKKFPKLVPVPEPINIYDFVAFTLDETIHMFDWNEMSGYSKCHIIGWKILEEKLKGQQNVYTVRTAEQLFLMLAARRTEVAMYERRQGFALANEKNIVVFASEPPLIRKYQFIFLHQKHKKLVRPLAVALRQMKRDGSYQRVVDRTLKPFDQ